MYVRNLNRTSNSVDVIAKVLYNERCNDSMAIRMNLFQV